MLSSDYRVVKTGLLMISNYYWLLMHWNWFWPARWPWWNITTVIQFLKILVRLWWGVCWLRQWRRYGCKRWTRGKWIVKWGVHLLACRAGNRCIGRAWLSTWSNSRRFSKGLSTEEIYCLTFITWRWIKLSNRLRWWGQCKRNTAGWLAFLATRSMAWPRARPVLGLTVKTLLDSYKMETFYIVNMKEVAYLCASWENSSSASSSSWA